VQESRYGTPLDRYYRDVEVVGDTVIGGAAWVLVRERQLDSTYTVVSSGHFASRVVVDSVEIDSLGCYWCGDGVSVTLPTTLVVQPVVIGGITYHPEGVGYRFRDGGGLPDWTKEWWEHATDIGLFRYAISIDPSGGPPYVYAHTLVYAVIRGVIYGQAPVATRLDPPDRVVPVLRVTPNPTRGQTWLDFELPEAADVRMEAFDALGRLMGSWHPGQRSTGAHVIPLDTSRWPAGVYVVRVAAGRWRLATRVVVR
jgi:hypothetical protein